MPRLPLLLLGLLLGWLTACATVGTRSNAQVAFEHGLSLFQRGQYAEAIPLFQEATQLDPDFGQAYLYLGRSYLNLGQWGNSATRLVPLPKRPNWPHSRWTRMWDWHGPGGSRVSSSKPWQWSKTALRLAPNDSTVRALLHQLQGR